MEYRTEALALDCWHTRSVAKDYFHTRDSLPILAHISKMIEEQKYSAAAGQRYKIISDTWQSTRCCLIYVQAYSWVVSLEPKCVASCFSSL